RDRPRRQGHGDEHRLRHRPADGHVELRGLRRVHVSCPTGALTNKRAVDVDLQEGEQITADDLLDLPMFAGASGTFLSLNRGSVVRRRFRAGDVICREGEYGSTAFYIVSGRVEVSIASPLAHVKS